LAGRAEMSAITLLDSRCSSFCRAAPTI
jgi:hypothetical protein